MDPQVDDPQEHVAPPEAVRDALSKFAELRAYAQQYFSAKADQWKLTARNIAVFAALGVVGLVVAGATIVIALVMLFQGLAGAIAAGLGGRMWAGNLIVGILLLGVFVGGAVIGLGVLRKAWFKATVKKYELTERQQRETFGRSSRDRTAAKGSVEV
jgi:hypothetical protein